MSQVIGAYYGFGFICEKEKHEDGKYRKEAEFTDEALCRFVMNHVRTLENGKGSDREAVSKIRKWMADNETGNAEPLDELFEEYSCHVGGTESEYALVSNIMTLETGIEFSCVETDGEYAVILEDTAPWWYNEKEKNLTEESLRAIMEPYVKELGLVAECLDRLTLPFCF